MLNAIKLNFKKIWIMSKYFRKKIRIGRNTNLPLDVIFEGNNSIGDHTTFQGSLGYGSYIGDDCHIYAQIGRFCSIANNVKFLSGKHPLNENIATSPVFYSNNGQLPQHFSGSIKYEERCETTIVESNVWIGYGATIIGGIRIGEGSVIGARALVNKDVEPYSIVAGLPAKIIKMRFSDEIIKKIVEFNIWNKSISWYAENTEILLDVNKFLQYSEEK